MAKKDTLPSVVRISNTDDVGEPVDLNCVFVPHEETGLRFATIELYGNREHYHQLQRRSGNIVRFQHLIETSEREPKQPDGLGRVLGGTWTYGSSVGASDIQRVGSITILRYDKYLSFSGEEDGNNRCGFVFHRQVKDWFDAGMFGLSYEGSIELRKCRHDANVLLNTRSAKGRVFKNYYFTEDDDKLIRFGLPAIEFEWKCGLAFDYRSHCKAAIAVLKFLFGVELLPISGHVSIDGDCKITVWPTELDRKATRHRSEGPLPFRDVPAFIKDGVRELSSRSDVAAVDDAINRYVHATTELSLEQSFVGGCEAIEALYKLADPTRPQMSTERAEVLQSIKSVVRRSPFGKAERSEIGGRIKGALLPGLWPRIYRFTLEARKGKEPEAEKLVSRCQFHRLRSQFVHGARATTGHEMFVQRDLMEYVFVSLLLYILGDKKRRPSISSTLRAELQGDGNPIRLIQIYD